MEIIDSHIHLYPEPNQEKELNISKEPVNDLLSKLSQKLKNNNVDEAVLYILDKNYLYTIQDIDIPNTITISSVVGIEKSCINDIDMAFNKNIKILKIHPYLQKITKDKYSNILEIANYANGKNIVLTIDCSYGSKLIYDTNGVELAAFIKKKVDIPIILAHGGGPKIFDAMSLALDYEDIFLDLSFSIKYWWGSSVIDDYAFALKKLSSKKSFYGSDYPYVDFDESLEYFLRFIRKYNFSEKDKNNMLYYNFEKFKGRYLL